jgi:hypothetical protein
MEDVLVYDVVRQSGGWAVAQGEQTICCYRSQEEAIAQARLLGHDAFDRGATSHIRVQTLLGDFRMEYSYGAPCPESHYRGGRY